MVLCKPDRIVTKGKKHFILSVAVLSHPGHPGTCHSVNLIVPGLTKLFYTTCHVVLLALSVFNSGRHSCNENNNLKRQGENHFLPIFVRRLIYTTCLHTYKRIKRKAFCPLSKGPLTLSIFSIVCAELGPECPLRQKTGSSGFGGAGLYCGSTELFSLSFCLFIYF